jgi:hypothetical protein
MVCRLELGCLSMGTASLTVASGWPAAGAARLLLVPQRSRQRGYLPVAFHVTHRFGGDEPDPPVAALGSLLDEVDEDPTDKEHVGVSVVHESGWAIGVYPGWRVILENVEELDVVPRHVDIGHGRDEALRLMRAAAAGDLSTLNRVPWRPGYGPQSS